ncbi:MAG: ribosome recycling factor [Dehalococcoidia bacterium]|nr:ribosome recycling factor [Dehalococcoidia bacterium]|tara:strand:- start:9976 stop:10557 length:582 start_codon:yes stop_codon:yes gene_type:complete
MTSGNENLTPEVIISDTDDRMSKSIDALKRDISTLKTGRATPSLLDNINVEYYGTSTPLNQLASISAPDAQAIIIQPWDKGSIQDIEKSLSTSDLGFNPSNDGTQITVPIPPLTQERRLEMVKLLKKKIEDGKVSVRNVRRDSVERLRKLEKDKSISQDDSRRGQDQIQKSTDNHTKLIDDIAKAKEEEITQV